MSDATHHASGRIQLMLTIVPPEKSVTELALLLDFVRLNRFSVDQNPS